MKTNNLIYYVLIFFFVFGCKEEKPKVGEEDVFYTCSMDPQVWEKKPGKCPVCKMELTKTIASTKEQKNVLRLSETQLKLANIKTIPVNQGAINGSAFFRGIISNDLKGSEIISSKVVGRIEKLYFKSIGQSVHFGDVLYDIYSEELQSDIRQYQLAKAKASVIKNTELNYTEMIKKAKGKLILAGLTEKQIEKLKESENPLVPVISERAGVVSEVLVEEGNYINEGDAILKLENYSSLWVDMEVYAGQEKDITVGKAVRVRADEFPDKVIEGRVSFIAPELKKESKVTIARVIINNKEGLLKPGMRALIELNSPEKKSLVIPSTAIIFEPNMNMVYVRRKDGAFQPKMVEVGINNNGKIEILKGLHPGDNVVVSGAYLLHSEFQLKKGGGEKGHTH